MEICQTTVTSPTIVDLTEDPAGGVVTSGAVQAVNLGYPFVNSWQIISSAQQQSYHIVNSNVPGAWWCGPKACVSYKSYNYWN